MVSEEARMEEIPTEKISKINVDSYNKCVHFILPILGNTLGWYINLINCYISNPETSEDNYLYIINEIDDLELEQLNGFTHKFKEKDNYVFIYRISDEFNEDFIKFTQGKYSEFSNQYKGLIYTLLRRPFRDSNVYKVLNKSLELKLIIENKVGQPIGDQEVLSSPTKKEYYE